MATIKIKTTHRCNIYIDGEYITTAIPESFTKININNLGIYYIESFLDVDHIIQQNQYLADNKLEYKKSNTIELCQKEYECLLILDFKFEYFHAHLSTIKKTFQIIPQLPLSLAQKIKLSFELKDGINQVINEIDNPSQLNNIIEECIALANKNIKILVNQVLKVSTNDILKLKCKIQKKEDNQENSIIIYEDYPFILNLPYQFYKEFEYGFAIVINNENGQYGIIDKAGNLILPCEYDSIKFLFPIQNNYPKILCGIINYNSLSSESTQKLFIINNFQDEFHISILDDEKCIYNIFLNMAITYKPIQLYMKKNHISEEYNIDPDEVRYNINIIDSKSSDWEIPFGWGEITKILDNNTVIFYEPNNGYGIANINFMKHSFDQPYIKGCEEIFYLGGDYYIIKNNNSNDKISEVEQWYRDNKKGTPSDVFWRFSKDTTIFNSNIYSIYEGFIDINDMKGDGIPCECHYINHVPNPFCNLPEFKGLIIVKGKISYNYNSNPVLEKEAYSLAGRGNNMRDFMENFYFDWESEIEDY